MADDNTTDVKTTTSSTDTKTQPVQIKTTSETPKATVETSAKQADVKASTTTVKTDTKVDTTVKTESKVETVVAPVVPKAEVPASVAASLNTPSTTQIINPQTTRSASIVAELLADYKNILNQKIVSAKQHQDAAKLLGTVITQLYASPTNLVFAEVWNFFSDTTNKNTFLRESAALGGVDVLAMSLRSRVELVYTLFRKAVQGVDVSTLNQDTLNNLVRLPQLIAYLSNKVNVKL